MGDAIEPPGIDAPAALSGGAAFAALAVRPTRAPGGQPAAAIILVEIDSKGAE